MILMEKFLISIFNKMAQSFGQRHSVLSAPPCSTGWGKIPCTRSFSPKSVDGIPHHPVHVRSDYPVV